MTAPGTFICSNKKATTLPKNIMKVELEQRVEVLIKAIDIAIDSIQKYPPKGFEPVHVTHFVNTYAEAKKSLLNLESRFQNKTSISILESEVFIYFQEGTGNAVDYFWSKVKEEHLPFKRVNKLAKVLKRDKIKNQIEYDFIIDVLVPYQQEGLISKDEVDRLNEMISNFEKKATLRI
jgi:hypothetical protein